MGLGSDGLDKLFKQILWNKHCTVWRKHIRDGRVDWAALLWREQKANQDVGVDENTHGWLLVLKADFAFLNEAVNCVAGEVIRASSCFLLSHVRLSGLDTPPDLFKLCECSPSSFLLTHGLDGFVGCPGQDHRCRLAST